MTEFLAEVEQALEVLRGGGLLLYPTDTVWSLGCDATNAAAVAKLCRISHRNAGGDLVILLADERQVLQYVASPDPAAFTFLAEKEKPTTVVFADALNLPDAAMGSDGSVAIRLVQDSFCRHLIKRLRAPLIAAPTYGDGMPVPCRFDEISQALKTAVDYVVRWRQEEECHAEPAQVIRWGGQGAADAGRG